MTAVGRTFSTSEVAPEARTQAWCQAVESLHFAMSFEAHVQTPYRGALKSYATADFRLISFDEEQCSFRREPAHIRADPSTDIELVSPTSGECTVEQFGYVADCRAGQFVLLDASAPFRIVQPKRMSALMLKVSRPEIERRFPDVEAICGRPITCLAGLPRLAIDLFQSIERESSSMDNAEFHSSCHHLVDLLALAIEGGQHGSKSNSAVRMATFKRIKFLIREKVFSAEFTARDIAAQLNISERYVQSLFQDSGTTVRDYLRSLRLSRAQEMLSSPRYNRKSITEIAYECGFPSSAYFSTAFREQTMQTPTEYRRSFLRNGKCP